MSSAAENAPRPLGISAFIRCKDEEEFIVASIASIYRFVDEVLVVFNHSTDQSRALVAEMAATHPKIRTLDYPHACAAVGPGYLEKVRAEPSQSVAAYYNWCIERTRFSHVCKWDGDMIGLPAFGEARRHIGTADVIMFDGADVVGEETTSLEPRVFRYDPERARYVDWDLYERLEHHYGRTVPLPGVHYLHMKLVKKEWRGRDWDNPNLKATAAFPATGAQASRAPRLRGTLRRVVKRIRRAGQP